MLAIIPLIWFSTLLFFLYSKKGVCVSAYITLLYVITSACALGLYKLTSSSTTEPSLFATLIYCLLITSSIIPIIKLEKRDLDNIEIANPKFLKILIFFYLFCFFFLLVFYWQDMIFRITLGDWDEIKSSATAGDAYSIRQFGGILRPISIVVRIFTSISFVMVPVFFLSLKSIHFSYHYSIAAVIGSLSSFMVSILDADRSRIFIWVIILGLCLVIFWKNLSRKMRRSIIPVIFVVLFGAIFYVYIVSISRFSQSDSGTLNSIVEYAGQPYSNFCYFFDNYNNGEGINTRVAFPFTHTFLFKDYVGGVDLQMDMTKKTGIYCSVFYTFLGMFVLDSNQLGPFLFVAFYLIIWSLVLRGVRKKISLLKFFEYFFLMVIPTYGCIAYMYSHWYLTFSIFLLLYFCKLSGNNRTIINKKT